MRKLYSLLPGAKAIRVLMVAIFLATTIGSNIQAAVYNLPEAQQMIPLSETYSFPVLKGLILDLDNPLHIQFVVDTANQGAVTRDEAARLIRYFLAGLTTAQEDLWVNLSPYESQRIIPEQLSRTDLGKDLLSQDYILKQLSSSLVYPESETGKDYWTKTYQELRRAFGTTKVAVDTFNKIWIMPDTAQVYENTNLAFITEAKLKEKWTEASTSSNDTDSADTTSTSYIESNRIMTCPVCRGEMVMSTNSGSGPVVVCPRCESQY